MSTHQHKDDILAADQLKMSPQFEHSLRLQLQKREAELTKSPRRRLSVIFAGITSLATVTALGLFIVLSLQNTQSPLNPDGPEPALARDVFERMADQPQSPLAMLSDLENNTQNELQGVFVQRDTYRDFGPAWQQCYTNTIPQSNALVLRQMYFSNPPEMEVVFEKTFGDKATEPEMYFDTNTDTERLTKVLESDQKLVQDYRERGVLVDAHGAPLEPGAEVMFTDDSQSSYSFFVTNVSKGLCSEAEGEEIVALTVRLSDLRILKTSIYVGAVSDETLVEATRYDYMTEEVGTYDQFKDRFIAEGFDEQVARAAAEGESIASSDNSEQVIQSGDEGTIQFDIQSLGDLYSSDEDGPQNSQYGYSFPFSSREDVLILVEDGLRDYSDGAGGQSVGPGAIGFEKEVSDDGSVRYVDLFYDRLKELDPSVDIASRYIDDVARSIEPFETQQGLQAIRVVAPGPFSGQPDLVYTVINTGLEQYPAILVREDAEAHARFKSDWQAFIDSVGVTKKQ